MRLLSAILLTALILSGLSMRAVAKGICCPEPHSHPSDCTPHDHGGCGDHDESPAHTHEDKLPSGGDSCPPDCGDHHHHGNCIHVLPISLTAEHHVRLPDLHSVSLQADRHHQRVPEGPVRELDKPPLI